MAYKEGILKVAVIIKPTPSFEKTVNEGE